MDLHADLKTPPPPPPPPPQVAPPPSPPPGGAVRHPASKSIDPGTFRLLVTAGSLGVALFVAAGVWAGFGHHHRPVPLLEADPGPIRVRPDNPGGMQIGASNDDVGAEGASGGGKLQPAAETPDTTILKAETKHAPDPAPVEMAPTVEEPALKPASPTTVTTTTTTTDTAPLPRHHQAAAPAPEPAPSAPVPELQADGAGPKQVQLAALDSEAAATAEWQRLQTRLPDLLGSRNPAITRVEVNGRIYYRLRVGGFASNSDASQFCHRVRAKGAACSIADF